jgi:Lar family restriction alleviation protein
MDLKPCPFCGSTKVEVKRYRKDGLKIGCKSCGWYVKQRVIKYSLDWLERKMIEHWNERAC